MCNHPQYCTESLTLRCFDLRRCFTQLHEATRPKEAAYLVYFKVMTFSLQLAVDMTNRVCC